MAQLVKSLEFTEYNDFLKRKTDRKYVLSLIVKKHDQQFERINEILKTNEFLRSLDVLLELVDLDNSYGFPDLFFSNQNYQCIFYIQGQPIELLEFHEKAQEIENVEEYVNFFVQNKISNSSVHFH